MTLPLKEKNHYFKGSTQRKGFCSVLKERICYLKKKKEKKLLSVKGLILKERICSHRAKDESKFFYLNAAQTEEGIHISGKKIPFWLLSPL